MKTLDTLEQEAKEARNNLIVVCDDIGSGSVKLADAMILASVAMMTYQLALASQSNCVNKIPKLRVNDWITWGGGKMPVSKNVLVDVEFRDGTFIENEDPTRFRWTHAHTSGSIDGLPNRDIIAYRISASTCKPQQE
jgi:hypothetical protein